MQSFSSNKHPECQVEQPDASCWNVIRRFHENTWKRTTSQARSSKKIPPKIFVYRNYGLAVKEHGAYGFQKALPGLGAGLRLGLISCVTLYVG